MEARFGYDFGQVRIHADDKAAESSKTVAARAYTTGRDIVFGEKQYAPGTNEGVELLAHELAHVVQQGRRSGIPSSNAAAESEADHVAPRAMLGQSVSVEAGVSGGIQRSSMREDELEPTIADLNQRIAEIEAQVEGVSLSEAEEKRLFEERNRLLEERAELQAQLSALTSEDPRLQDSGERRRRFDMLKKRLDEPRSYPGREADRADFDAAKPLVEEERAREARWARYHKMLDEEWNRGESGYRKLAALRRWHKYMSREEFELLLETDPGFRGTYKRFVKFYSKEPEPFNIKMSDIGEVAGRPISASTHQEYLKKKNAIELGSLYENVSAAPIEVALAATAAAPSLVAAGETTVAVGNTLSTAALEIKATVTTYGLTFGAAAHLGRSAYTFYLQNAVTINEIAPDAIELALDLSGVDTPPISVSDGISYAVVDEGVDAVKGTFKAIEGEVIGKTGDIVHIETRSVREIDGKTFAKQYDSGKQIHVKPKDDTLAALPEEAQTIREPASQAALTDISTSQTSNQSGPGTSRLPRQSGSSQIEGRRTPRNATQPETSERPQPGLQGTEPSGTTVRAKQPSPEAPAENKLEPASSGGTVFRRRGGRRKTPRDNGATEGKPEEFPRESPGSSSDPELVLDETELLEQTGVKVRKPTEIRLAEAKEGRLFDEIEGRRYPKNQVPLREKSGKYRWLDSWDPKKKEIVSRKSLASSQGQLAFADVDTVIEYYQEFALKYPKGKKIPNVPSARRQGIAGQVLDPDSTYILEVPVQRHPIPDILLEEANRRGIKIRDPNGKVYN